MLQRIVFLILTAAVCATPTLAADREEIITITGEFTVARDGKPAMLFITATMLDGWHTYSLTQRKGGPLPTRIKLKASSEYRLLSKTFEPHPPPAKEEWADILPGLIIETHSGKVVWTVPIEIAEGVDPQELKIEGKVNAMPNRSEQAVCVPPRDFPFSAKVGSGVSSHE